MIDIVKQDNINGQTVPSTTSLKIAEVTGKEHKHVIRDIENLVDTGKFNESNFGFSTYQDKKGEFRKMYILDQDFADFMYKKYEGLGRAPYSQKEKIALSTIEQLLGVKLERQYRVGQYRIDGYDPVKNVAYEIDEDHHTPESAKKRDKNREDFIKSKLGCAFKRIDVSGF